MASSGIADGAWRGGRVILKQCLPPAEGEEQSAQACRGWSTNLEGMQGSDSAGASGLSDRTDMHLDRLIAAIGMSAIVSVVANNAEEDDEDGTLAQIVGDAAAQEAAQPSIRSGEGRATAPTPGTMLWRPSSGARPVRGVRSRPPRQGRAICLRAYLAVRPASKVTERWAIAGRQFRDVKFLHALSGLRAPDL